MVKVTSVSAAKPNDPVSRKATPFNVMPTKLKLKPEKPAGESKKRED